MKRTVLLRLCFAMIVLASSPGPIRADAPLTGRELAQACEAALRHDFKGMDAAMCEWYVRPCAVCGVNKPPPTHCLPAGLSTRDLAAQVSRDLRASAPLLARPVKDAVERVLRLRYPCTP